MRSIEKEMHKQRPNITTLKDLMTRTVSLRDDIFQNDTTAEVLNKCPFISIPSLVSFLEHCVITCCACTVCFLVCYYFLYADIVNGISFFWIGTFYSHIATPNLG